MRIRPLDERYNDEVDEVVAAPITPEPFPSVDPDEAMLKKLLERRRADRAAGMERLAALDDRDAETSQGINDVLATGLQGIAKVNKTDLSGAVDGLRTASKRSDASRMALRSDIEGDIKAADAPFMEKKGELDLRKLLRGERIDSATEDNKIKDADLGTANLSQNVALGGLKLGETKKSLDSTSNVSTASREQLKSRLLQRAGVARQQGLGDTAKALEAQAQTVEGLSAAEVDQLDKESAPNIQNSSDSGSYGVDNFLRGDQQVGVLVNRKTGAIKELGEGKKPVAASGVGKAEEKVRDRYVTGEGLTARKKDAEDLSKLKVATANVSDSMDKLSALYKQYGSSLGLPGKGRDEVKIIADDMKMRLKDYYGLGAPQAAELKFLDQITTNPSSAGTIFRDVLGASPDGRITVYKNKITDGYNKGKGQYIIVPESNLSETEREAVGLNRREVPKTPGKPAEAPGVTIKTKKDGTRVRVREVSPGKFEVLGPA